MPLLPTSLVGSYAQPDWLIDRKKLAGRFPPRVRAKELWRVAPEFLDQAQDDATLIAIRDQERAGLDIITDGEMRRESYSNRFATALEGVDIDNPGTALDRSGHPNPVPRVTGKVRRKHPVEVRDVEFLRANTDRTIKITVPGPFTMSQQAQNDFYKDEQEMVLDYAAAVNAEIKDLFAAGADIVQIDEPYMQARPEKARKFGLAGAQCRARRRATAPRRCISASAMPPSSMCGRRAIRSCRSSPTRRSQQVSIETAQSKLDCAVLEKLPGKTIILGTLDLSDMTIETPETVAARIRRALPHVPAERIVVAPDCGLKYLPREVAYGKMCAMVEGAKIVRAELGYQMANLFPTSLVGSYPQPDWLIDRARLSKMVPRVRMQDLWLVDPQAAGSKAGRGDAARHPRPGARRPRHHHRRRAAARKLFQPLRHRARRRRHRESRHARSTAAASRSRCRASPAGSGANIRSRCATCNSCAPTPASR